MARPKKPKYEYVESLKQYRKRIKDMDGKYIAIYAKTPAELTRKIQEAEQAIARGLIDRQDPCVCDYAEKWLSLYTVDMAAKNKEIYTSAVRLHINPQIGHIRMSAVRPDDAKLVMNALVGKSASLQSKVLNTMRSMFENAVDNGLIEKNPCAKLKNNGYKTKEKVALTATQKQTLIDAVNGTNAYTFVLLGLYTGMRREEILGLKWDCVVLTGKAPHVIVKRAVRWDHNRPVVSEELKSEAAARTIPIPKELVAHLKQIQQPEGHVVGGDPLTQTQFKNLWRLVNNRKIGAKTYAVPYSDTKEKVTFMRELGAKSRGGNFHYTIDFDVTPHILRHTYITDLILSGANIKAVQYLAGHADVSVTLDIYSHLVEKSPEKLASAVTSAFEVKHEVKPEA